jgi:hypothetical protein
MPQEPKSKKDLPKNETARPRNEANPGQTSVGTSTSEKIDAENSPDVRDALNESQL